jgi:hypothetical protein
MRTVKIYTCKSVSAINLLINLSVHEDLKVNSAAWNGHTYNKPLLSSAEKLVELF